MSWSRSSEGVCSGELPLRALRVRVRPDRVEVEIVVAAERYAQTDSKLIAECLGHVPTLGQHLHSASS